MVKGVPPRSLTAILAGLLITVIALGITSAYLVGRSRVAAAGSAAESSSAASANRGQSSASDEASALDGATGPDATEPASQPASVAESSSVTGPATVEITAPAVQTTTAAAAARPADPAGEGTPATGPTSARASVQLSQTAAADPRAAHIQDLMTRYFAAINNRDYPAWAATVTVPLGQDDWNRVYQSTVDSDALIHRITDSDGGGIQIQLSFISRQSPELAPPQLPVSCIAWVVVYGIDVGDAGYTVGESDPSRRLLAQCK